MASSLPKAGWKAILSLPLPRQSLHDSPQDLGTEVKVFEWANVSLHLMAPQPPSGRPRAQDHGHRRGHEELQALAKKASLARTASLESPAGTFGVKNLLAVYLVRPLVRLVFA